MGPDNHKHARLRRKGGGERGANLLLQPRQDIGPVCQAVQRPCQHGCRRLVASDEHRHQIVPQLLACDLRRGSTVIAPCRAALPVLVRGGLTGYAQVDT